MRRMRNNKGFTVVELIVSFALVMVIAYFLFTLLYSLRNLSVDSSLKTELLEKQALMVREIERDLENKKLVLATYCGDYCLDFTFDDDSTKRLTLNKGDGYFRYGSYAIDLLEGSSFGEISVSNEQVLSSTSGLRNDSMITFDIPITNELVEGDYGIHIVYQYNSYEVSFNDLIFDDTSDPDNLLYLKGSSNMIVGTDEGYTEPGYFWIDSSGTKHENGDEVIVTGLPGTTEGTYTVIYTVPASVSGSGKDYVRTRTVTIQNKVYNFEFVKSAQTFLALYDGTYRIELWGAQGGCSDLNDTYCGGAGAYVSGEIELEAGEQLYVYVGEQKLPASESSTDEEKEIAIFNGGGYSQSGAYGGGATDVRLASGDWYNESNLKNRIMVAGGGGGVKSTAEEARGGVGGTTTGGTGSAAASIVNLGDYVGYGGSHNEGGRPGSDVVSAGSGALGKGGKAGYPTGDSSNYGAGGGGGYYGGSGSGGYAGAGGGSSFISGADGFQTVSGYTFTNTQMLDGLSLIPNPRLGYETLGNTGNGYARITLLTVKN